MQVLLDNSNHDAFLSSAFVSGAFLQSSLWRAWLETQGQQSWQLVLKDGEKTKGFCLLYERRLPFGKSYLYAPKGPIFDQSLAAEERREALALMLSKVRDLLSDTKKREEIFLKLDLPQPLEVPSVMIKTDDIQPRDSWILDLNATENQLLSATHPKTRYNIGLARRRGVFTTFSQSLEDLQYFLVLIKKTAARNQISVHSDDYYRKLWSILIKNRVGYLALAKKNDRVIAANILVNFAASTTYLHGASDYQQRSLMAPQLLQWDSILKAREWGKRFYDFWGIAPADGSKSRWQGLTRFKKGFGGQVASSPGAYSLVYDSTWYGLHRFFGKLRQTINRLRI